MYLIVLACVRPARDVLVIDSSLAPEDFIFIEGDIDQQVDEIPGYVSVYASVPNPNLTLLIVAPMCP